MVTVEEATDLGDLLLREKVLMLRRGLGWRPMGVADVRENAMARTVTAEARMNIIARR